METVSARLFKYLGACSGVEIERFEEVFGYSEVKITPEKCILAVKEKLNWRWLLDTLAVLQVIDYWWEAEPVFKEYEEELSELSSDCINYRITHKEHLEKADKLTESSAPQLGHMIFNFLTKQAGELKWVKIKDL